MAKVVELDKDLVDGLKAAKSKRAYFVLVLKGSNDGALIVSKTKVAPTEIAESKKRSGGTAVVAGFCSYEDGTYVFETAKDAPATADQAVKNITKRDAGLVVKAEFRLSNDPELLADQGGKSTGTGKPQQLDGAAVIKRFNALTEDVKAALAGPNKARVQPLYVAVREQIQKSDFAGATKNLDVLEPLVKQSKASASQTQDGAAARGNAADEYRKKLAVLSELAKKLISEKRIDKSVVSPLLQAAQTAATDGDYATGLQKLATLEAALNKALAASNKAASDDDDSPAENEQQLFEARLKTVGADVLGHVKSNAGDREALTELLHDARDAAAAGDFETGHRLLDRIDRIIIAGKRAARGAEMAEQIAEGAGSSGAVDSDRISTAMAAWIQSRDTAVSGAGKLAAELRNSVYEDLRPIAVIVEELVDGFPIGLDDCLEDLRVATIEGDTPRIKQFQSRSKTEIKACLEYLNVNSNVIAACEQHPLSAGPVSIAAPLKQSLKTILELVK